MDGGILRCIIISNTLITISCRACEPLSRRRCNATAEYSQDPRSDRVRSDAARSRGATSRPGGRSLIFLPGPMASRLSRNRVIYLKLPARVQFWTSHLAIYPARAFPPRTRISETVAHPQLPSEDLRQVETLSEVLDDSEGHGREVSDQSRGSARRVCDREPHMRNRRDDLPVDNAVHLNLAHAFRHQRKAQLG